jgi:hypothetical protein
VWPRRQGMDNGAMEMRDWLPEGHLARFVDELVDQLDRSAIYTVMSRAIPS